LSVQSTSLEEVTTILRALDEAGCRCPGHVVETDWRPNRVELAAPDRGWVDLHPLQVEKDGGARQPALDGGFHTFPASWSTVGRLAGLPVPCVTCEAQIAFRRGYELRPADHHDLMVLRKMRPGE
jgi:lincosamide nucleotidyltransferase A/C/D/E